MPVDRLEEIVGPRHGDEVMAGAVIGRHLANADIGAGRCNELVGFGQNEPIGNGLRANEQAIRQALALVNRENGELLQEREAALSFAACVVALAMTALAVAVDDRRTMFAVPHRAAERRSLPEGQKAVPGKSPRNNRIPEREDVDAAVAPLARGVERQADRGAGAAPGLDPGQPPRFQFGNDPAGDLLVKRDPRVPLAVCGSMVRHVQSPAADRQRASLAAPIRRPDRPASSSCPRAGGASRHDRGQRRRRRARIRRNHHPLSNCSLYVLICTWTESIPPESPRPSFPPRAGRASASRRRRAISASRRRSSSHVRSSRACARVRNRQAPTSSDSPCDVGGWTKDGAAARDPHLRGRGPRARRAVFAGQIAGQHNMC